MIINSLKIRNIRSYVDEVIEFPPGTTLLSGDIGSGKSSILYAVEFALFGILRGTFSGASMLRHGTPKGSVELNVEIDGKKIVIHRALTRSKDTVNQDKGFVMVDGNKFEGTPVELKAKILGLIGYPEELISKSKSLIFRYTVYTPQEEMKSILFEGEDQRLDTLRKIFNIDKYKRIKENSAILARDLRSNVKMLESNLQNLDGLKEKSSERAAKKKELEKKHSEVKAELEAEKDKVAKAKKIFSESEEQAVQYNKMEKEFELTENSLKAKQERLFGIRSDVEQLTKSILEVEKEIKGKEVKENKDKITKGEEAIAKLREKLSTLREKEATLTAKKDQAEEIKNKIIKLDECPTCQQKVTEEHSKEVIQEQNSVLKKINEKLKKALALRKQFEDNISKFEQRVSELREEEKKFASLREKIKNQEEKKERKEKLLKEEKEQGVEVKILEKKKADLQQKLDKNKDVAVLVKKSRKDYEELQEKLKAVEIEEVSLKKELQGIIEVLKELDERIKAMEKEKEKISKIKQTLEWIDKYFVKIMDVIEKQVMLRIHAEFNEYFMSWFNVLMEDETLNVRLDERFTPVIIQDGYETTVENLSGGEKTSVALAYRLSLNKVINDFISTIKTKDLIILDEPTDGFSSEQLDRVREVLKELNVKQTILVSHEPKMESYVDHVINVSKQENMSKVL